MCIYRLLLNANVTFPILIIVLPRTSEADDYDGHRISKVSWSQKGFNICYCRQM